MALPIAENWIREKVQLKHNNLEDVKSLALPGTYHDKIGALGNALKNFTRLKSLDLSRNAIESLEGLESLKCLEKLNLYYNNIVGLSELYRLRYNQKLQDLDLRLNPVARNEPDYRLFLIHMLPNLRRLDDRSVRDSERQAALTHFSSDQAAEMTPHQQAAPAEKTVNPRVEHVRSLAKPASVLDAEDVEVLDLIAQTGGDLSQPRQVTGSNAKLPESTDYTREEVQILERAALTNSHPATILPQSSGEGVQQQEGSAPIITQASSQQSLSHPASGHTNMNNMPRPPPQRYPNLPSVTMTAPTPPTPDDKNGIRTIHLYQPPQQERKKNSRVQFAEDPNLRFPDENEAYLAYKATGHFTPHPGMSEPPAVDVVSHPHTGEPESLVSDTHPEFRPQTFVPHPAYTQINPYTVDMYTQQEIEQPTQEESSLQNIQNFPSLPAPFRQGAPPYGYEPEDEEDRSVVYEHGQFIRKLCDMVDKYWNGTKSLHNHQRFMYMSNKYATEYLKQFDASRASELSKLKDELVKVEQENSKLKEKLTSAARANLDATAEEEKLKKSLIYAQREVDVLRAKLQKTADENRNVQDRLNSGDHGDHSIGVTSSLSSSTDQAKEALSRENAQLRRDVETAQVRLKQFSQMQELASMLQESHKSLVQTNDHLLRDLNETRQRHQTEVKQLHWSYDQLKKTVGYLPQPANSNVKPAQFNGRV